MPITFPRRIAVVVAAGALLGLSACGSDDTSAAKGGSAATQSGSSVPSALVGAWTRVMTKADVRRTQSFREDYGPGQSAPAPGKQLMTVEEAAPQGRLAIAEPGAPDPPIAMDIVANAAGELRLVSYVDARKGTFCGVWRRGGKSDFIPIPAHYSWKVNGDSLTLKPTREGCADRDAILAGHWTRG